ncbi:uncharacterized protein [Hoplias malabaricus]|uniref:uncharacterized protein isoform X1 n=1 Tax=Hoplias malabaricus TaxID=27720 RepID=UPI00346251CA
MEEDLESFLRSRGVSEEDLDKMKRDKIDRSVLLIMTDEERAKYIRSYGDRLAVISFCKQKDICADKGTLLERLKQKIFARRTGSKQHEPDIATTLENGMSRHNNKNAQKSSRRLEIGWLHFSKNDYHQVRTRNGGGTRHMLLDKYTTVAQIMEMGKNLFFQNGHSPKGAEEDFTFTICDFKRNQVSMESTLFQLYEECKLKMLRLYICTKEKVSSVMIHETSSDSDDNTEWPSSKSLPHRSLTEEILKEQGLQRHKRQKMFDVSQNQHSSAAPSETLADEVPGPLNYLHSTPNEGRSYAVMHSTQDFQDENIIHISSHAEECLNETGIVQSSHELQDTPREYEVPEFNNQAHNEMQQLILIPEDSEIEVGHPYYETVDELASTIEWDFEYNHKDITKVITMKECLSLFLVGWSSSLYIIFTCLINFVLQNDERNEVQDVVSTENDPPSPSSVGPVNAEDLQHVQVTHTISMLFIYLD